MNILHYTVGLNENRGGGLTKYVDDLTEFQSKSNNVIVLYPGEYSLFSKKVCIKREKNKKDILIYSIVNPLSLPMMFGLKDEDYLVKKTSVSIWKSFLEEHRIDLVHLHTLMGLYEEFIDAANELNIPLVYTTHDYFGLCSKQTFVYDNKICENWRTCEDCSKCNQYAFSKTKAFIVHSKLFCKIRKNKLFLKLKNNEKRKIDKVENVLDDLKENPQQFYLDLKNKCVKNFSKINVFHFNSSVSERIFRRELPNINGKMINIMHSDIKDHRRKKDFSGEKLRITYLGPATSAKGFDLLIDTLDKVYLKYRSFELHIYTNISLDREYISRQGDGYQYSQLPQIMNTTDVLVAPSIYDETFGFTVAEALSYAVPVMVSDTLGAKDIVTNGENGFVINAGSFEKMLEKILKNKSILETMNRNILNSKFTTFEEHCKKIMDMYQDVLKEES